MSGLGFGLYLVFMCSWFLHLPTRFPFLATVRADLLLMCVIFALVLLNQDEAPAPTGERRSRNLLWTLVIYALVTIPFVEWPGSVIKNGFPQFLKGFVFFYFTASLVTTRPRLKYLLGVFIACQTFRVLEPLYLHITEGYWGSVASMADWEEMNRLSGAPDDIVNPNGLASIVLTVVPFLHYLTSGSVPGRLVYVTTLPLLMYALVLTGSRSGMIGLAAILALVWFKSQHKIALLLLVLVAVGFAAPRLSPDMQDRYVSIFSGQTKNAATAQTRFERLGENLQVTMHRPLFGHGLGTSREANVNFGATDQMSHNLYIEIAQELGVVGLIIFLMFIKSLLSGLGHASAALRRMPQPPLVLSGLVQALHVFIGMNLLFSFASYGLSGYEWYLTAGLADVVERLARQPAEAVRPAAVAAGAPFATWSLPSRT